MYWLEINRSPLDIIPWTSRLRIKDFDGYPGCPGTPGSPEFILPGLHGRTVLPVHDFPRLRLRLAPRQATAEDIAGRCSFIAGDLFREWPVSSPALVLARVLHDCPDADAVRILRRAREAMGPGGCLYVVEMVMDEFLDNSGLLNLNMLVTTG